MIQVEKLTKKFEDFTALDSISIHVDKGSVYGLVGPNGAGKSTLIRHLTGVYRPNSGNVLINGQPVYENPVLKEKIAYIPDDLYYFTSASTKDMMRFYKGIYKSFDAKLYEALKEVFKIDEKRAIRKLSKGMQKQVAFWLAICTRPEVLVLDEPVDGLDPVMRRQVWSIIMNDVTQYNTTVLVSSHNLRELEDVCDHVGIINKGKLALERSLSELQDNIVKLQVAFADDNTDLSGLDIVNRSSQGKLTTLIVRGIPQQIKSIIACKQPLFMDMLPLTLEEIFIYELGGADYEVKNILL